MNKVYINPFGVHSLCSWPDVIHTSMNVKKLCLFLKYFLKQTGFTGDGTLGYIEIFLSFFPENRF